MAYECQRILVGFLLTLRSHHGGGDFQRLTNSHVAGLAAVDDICIRHVDLHDLGIPLFRLFLQTLDLRGGELYHALGNKR